jgi:hypothetical protein
MDRSVPARIDRPASEIGAIIDATPAAGALLLRIHSTEIAGGDVARSRGPSWGEQPRPRPTAERSGAVPLAAVHRPVITSVRAGSEAARLKLRPGDKISSVVVPNPRAEPFWFGIPALMLLGCVALLQRQQRTTRGADGARASTTR